MTKPTIGASKLVLVLAALSLVGACDGASRPSTSGAADEGGATGAVAGEGGAGGELGEAGSQPVGGASAAGEGAVGGARPLGDAGAGGADGGGAGAAGAAGAGGAPDTSGPDLFGTGEVLEFRIKLSEQALAALAVEPNTYQAGSLEFQGETWESVGVRLKGRASAQGFDQKPAFKIKLNELVPGQRLAGLKRLTLNNMVQDATMMRERLGYEYLRALGLPAPRCNHARVYVNDVYYGLYLNLETLDEVFVKRVYPGAGVGNLFDITNDEYFIDFERGFEPPAQETKFVLETNEDAPDTSDLTALIDAIDGATDEDFVTRAEGVLDLDEVLLLGAAQAVLADWDGYFGARNNYKAYHELERDRFVIFPWGIDQTFWPEYVDYAIDHSQSFRPRSIVLQRCEALEACRTRYRSHVSDAVEKFSELPLAEHLETWLRETQPDIDRDQRKPFSALESQLAIAELRTFLSQRAASVKAQLIE